MDVSICIVNYNSSLMVIEVINKILKYTNPSLLFEIIVVNNSPEDRSFNAIETNFYVSDNFKFNGLKTNYWIYRKHLDHPIAKPKIDYIVLDMYGDKNKQKYLAELNDYRNLEGSSFMSKAIKYRLPYFFYNFAVLLKKKIFFK